MKKSILKIALIFCLAIMSACGSGGPEGAAINFLESMYSGDFETARKYATTDTKSMLTMMESFGAKDQLADKMKDVDIDFKVIETKIDGDKAVCTIQMSSSAEGEEDKDERINLIKKDGKWLVNMDKEGLNKEGMNKLGKPNFNSDEDSNED